MLNPGTKSTDRAHLLDLGSTSWNVLITLISLKSFIGPRELARHMGLSSPSVALYHLDKLVERGFLEKNVHGEYRIDADADLGFLDNFLFLRERVIPRTLFYAVVFTGVFLFYLVTVGSSYDVHNVFTIVLGILGCSFLWAEVYRIWSGLL
ncbi:MAG: hypothetical protein K9W43_10205 [Candidatus Thorarchaeota archaeon]|nr:hypothetical protein [Candidatus Thorarchaeota archaeon]